MKQMTGKKTWMFLCFFLFFFLLISLASAIDTIPITADSGWSTGGAAAGYCSGTNASANMEFWITGFTKAAAGEAFYGKVQLYNGTVMGQAAAVGNYVTFSPAIHILNGQVFFIVVTNLSYSYTENYKSFTNPAANETYFTTQGRCLSNPNACECLWQQPTYTGEIISIDVSPTNPAVGPPGPVGVILNAPANSSNFITPNINFNFTATSDNGTMNCNISLDGALNQTNASTKTGVLTNFLINGISYSSHYWEINCSDLIGGFNSSIGTFTVNNSDIPNVTLNSPVDGYGSLITPFIFNCSATDAGYLSNISFYTNYTGAWARVATNNVSGSSASTTFSFTPVATVPTLWSCSSCDAAGNCNKTFAENRTVVNTTPAPAAVTDLTPIIVTLIIGLAIILFLIIVGLGFYAKEYAIAALGSIGLMGTGVYVLTQGISVFYNNIITDLVGIVLIGLGGYIMIRGAIELMLEYYDY